MEHHKLGIDAQPTQTILLQVLQQQLGRKLI